MLIRRLTNHFLLSSLSLLILSIAHLVGGLLSTQKTLHVQRNKVISGRYFPSQSVSRVYAINSPRDTVVRKIDDEIKTNLKSPNRNVTEQNKSQTTGRSFVSMEEKSKRELEWIVRNTEKVLGEDSAPVGSMSMSTMKVTKDLMGAWARRALRHDGSKAPHVVERLLQRLIKEQDAENELVSVDSSHYNKVLEAWANSSAEGSAERSEEILLRMEKMFLEERNEAVKPDEASYNAVIKAYVKNGNRQIVAAKVGSIIQRMDDQKDSIGVSPTKRSYNLLLYALANSSVENAAQIANDALVAMCDRFEKGDVDCKPDVNSYNQVMTAWARGKSKNFEFRMQDVYKELLNRFDDMGIEPNTDSFNTAMGGWLKSNQKSSLDVLLSILNTMEVAYENGNSCARPDRVTINTLTAAYIKEGEIEKSLEETEILEKKYDVSPNTISQNTIVASWCKSGRADAPRRVLDLLTAMENAYKNGRSGMMPDGYTYSSVIGCFNRFNRKNCIKVAEELLERMKDLYINYDGQPPTDSVYNAVLNAWTTHPDKRKRLHEVKDILKRMEENGGKDKSIPKPNRVTYNTVIKALRDGTGKSADFAEEILANMERKGVSENGLLPNSYTYTSVISVIGKSNCSNKAQRAFAILLRMLVAVERGNLSAVPSWHSYNAVLNACAFVRGDQDTRKDAFDIAMKTYEMMKERTVADHTTYGTLLRICATLLPATEPKREQLVKEFFVAACETGNVGRLVATQLKFAATRQQHIDLTGETSDNFNIKNLPKEWTRNVRENDRRNGSRS